MLSSKIKSSIHHGEGLQVEFKECNSALSKSIFETICAFLNRSGGELFLGISDTGKVLGIKPELINKIKNNFVVTMNNPTKISPSFYLSIEEIFIEDKLILYIYVHESSQVHRCDNKIFDRNEDGDFNITDKQHSDQTERTAKILDFCQEERSRVEIMEFLGLTHREHFRVEILNPLLKQGLLHPIIPDKPKSSKQKYYSGVPKKETEQVTEQVTE